MAVGAIPRSWRDKRRMLSFSLKDPLPFLDVELDATLSFLTREIASALAALGIQNLDQGQVRGSNRMLTRTMANWAYTQVDENDEAIYSGIRYSSRFQSHECWAIFEGVDIAGSTLEQIEQTDRHLTAVAREFALTIH